MPQDKRNAPLFTASITILYIKESFEIRNLSMHEYLNPALLSSPMLPNSFRFL